MPAWCCCGARSRRPRATSRTQRAARRAGIPRARCQRCRSAWRWMCGRAGMLRDLAIARESSAGMSDHKRRRDGSRECVKSLRSGRSPFERLSTECFRWPIGSSCWPRWRGTAPSSIEAGLTDRALRRRSTSRNSPARTRWGCQQIHHLDLRGHPPELPAPAVSMRPPRLCRLK